MSETTVRVDIRQAVLSENARLRDAGELLFLALDNPPPVRSLLRIVDGDEHKAFEVARVIEVLDDSEAARGCYGRYVDLERLAAQTRVGSEHLEPGVATSGVPAPVVIMSTGDMMLGEAGEEGEVAASEGAAEGSGDASDEGDASQ
jgi:hypothetical protein